MNTFQTRDVVADIGGTNARFACIDGYAFSNEHTFSCAKFPRFEDAFIAYCQLKNIRVENAAIAIANPILGDLVKMTNHHWSFSIARAQQELQLKKFLVLNDFEALARSLPSLPSIELKSVGTGIERHGVKAVIGAGTGLGASCLVPHAQHWLAVAGEGGHATYCAETAREWQLHLALKQKFSGNVSFERVASGPGLVNIYEALASVDGVTVPQLTPAEISARALANDDSRCSEVMDLFCTALGSAAGNLALTVGAIGGVYIGGGIVPPLGEYFARSPFRAAFENKGRFRQMLSEIPCYVIHSPHAAFHGAAASLRE